MKHLNNMLDGVVIMLKSMSSSRPYITNSGGFVRDFRNLAKDVRVVSAHLKAQSDDIYGAYTTGKSKKR